MRPRSCNSPARRIATTSGSLNRSLRAAASASSDTPLEWPRVNGSFKSTMSPKARATESIPSSGICFLELRQQHRAVFEEYRGNRRVEHAAATLLHCCDCRVRTSQPPEHRGHGCDLGKADWEHQSLPG